MNVFLRNLTPADLKHYVDWYHPDNEYHNWNGPYYNVNTTEELNDQLSKLQKKVENGETLVFNHKKFIAEKENDEIIGEVSWYWKSKETHWLEIGIVIFDEKYWNKGIGSKACILWIDCVFSEFPELARIGLTTWSGNFGMIKLAKKLGMKQEACYRNARIVNGKYYDSVSYGILKKEWKTQKKSKL